MKWLEKIGVMVYYFQEDIGIVGGPCYLPDPIVQWHAQKSFLQPENAHQEKIGGRRHIVHLEQLVADQGAIASIP